ncbi:MAG: PG0541 family transporter-associated protein [Bacteroidota bacterium]
MKAIFIVYNQAQTEKIEYLFDKLNIRGFTRWTELTGRGSVDGPPHMNTHTWPEQNTARLAVMEEDAIEAVLDGVRRLDEENKEVGIRAFVWNIEAMY